MKGKRLTTEQFIEKTKTVHKDKYDYSLVEYKNNKTKVKIICKKHGIFEQEPKNHIKGQGCPKCAKERQQLKQKDNTESFIKKAQLYHSYKYNYSKTVYGKTSKEKVTITCSTHGDFDQTPNNHLTGSGCPICGKEKGIKKNKENPMGWKTSDWVRVANNSKVFDSFKVYIIKCWNEEEEFYKIGKTFSTVKYRFKCKKEMPYNYKVIKIFKGEADEMSKLEKQLQKQNKQHKYIPKIKFLGQQECFKQIEDDKV